MNCQVDMHSWLQSVQNCLSRAVRSCLSWIPCLQRWRQVHPVSPGFHGDIRLIHLSSHRHIRVIHIQSESQRQISNLYKSKGYANIEANDNKLEGFQFSNQRKSLSLLSNYSDLSSEEYWFTRWNRPLKMTDPCNCSFRKSWRNSVEDSQMLVKSEVKVVKQESENSKDVKQKSENPPILKKENVPSKMNNSVYVEPFVEELLAGIWSEVFTFVSRIDSDSYAFVRSSSNKQKFCNDAFQNETGLNYHNNVKFESNINCKNIDKFNCKTLISCQESESGLQIKETMKESVGDLTGSTGCFHSVGCVNPSFLGSRTNPDILDCGALNQGQDFLHTNELKLDIGNVKCSEDPDSGFNTASLESTNQPVLEMNDPLSSNSNDKLDGAEVSPDSDCQDEIVLNDPKSDTVMYDKTLNAKDITPQNQTSLTSVNRRLMNPNIELKSNKSNAQHSRNKQCYHNNVTRLKPLLYFLHGVGCSADLWSYLLQHFSASGYEVLAPDMLGHGYSTAPNSPGAYTFHRLLKDVIDIFDKFVRENKSCVVIGHAFGCSLAVALCRYRPQHVSHLVLISGGGPAPLAPHTENGPPSVSPCLQACLKPLLMCGFRRNILYAPRGKHIQSSPSMSKGVPHYVLKYISEGQDWPEGDAAFHRRILAPTLLVHGLKDPYVTLVQECEMERTIPRSFLELIPNAGHYSMLETPARLSHMIHCFIDWWSR